MDRRISSYSGFSLVSGVLAAGLLFLVAGCASSSETSSTGSGGVTGGTGGTGGSGGATGAGLSFGGKVMAGVQPVIGATVQLYSSGASGYGSAGTALLSSPIMTNSSGGFTVPAGYSCASSSTQVYLVARGGSVGSGSTSNSALAMMTALGNCGSITSGEAVVLNEVTTVASVAAVAEFYSNGGNVGASSTNAVGLANAFGTANQLANMTNGASPGASLPVGLSVPSAKINSLASILNSCTGSNGGSCSALMTAATVSGETAPTNTLDSVYNILRNPANNVSALNALLPTTPAFSPVTASTVPEWTLAVTWSGGGMHLPTAMAFDSSGNAWVASYFNALTELPALGTAGTVQQIAAASGVLNESYGLTVDGSNNIWVSNEETSYSINTGYGNVVKFSNSGQVLSGTNGFTAGGVYFPQGLAADTTGNVWVVDYGDSQMTLLGSNGTAVNGATAWGTGKLAIPVAVAVDAGHNAWVANQSSNTITEVSPDGSKVTEVSCCDGASGLAVDQGGNVWVANYFGNSISEVSGAGVVLVNQQTGGGVDHPQGIAVDGSGRVWVGNLHKATVSEFSGASSSTPGTPLSPSAGFGTDAQMGSPFAVAIDQSGNLWVTNSNGANTVTVFVGLATPVKSPLLGPAQLP